jgi:hypothetical protein
MNTMRRFIQLVIILGAGSLLIFSCGNKSDNGNASTMSDKDQIQEVLNEAVTRWQYGDKGVLYDNEFECIREKFNFDEYLKFGQVGLNADSLSRIDITKVKMFGRDSALVDVDVIFKGTKGRISHAFDQYMCYWHQGRWIRPTISSAENQREFEQNRRAADSAADAEAKELGDD